MKLEEIKSGTRVIVLHNGMKAKAVVNGAPYLVAVTEIEPTVIQGRIPVHIGETNENVDCAQENIWRIGWDRSLQEAVGSMTEEPS